MRRQNSSLKNVFLLILTILVIAGSAFIYLSPALEKKAPKIVFDNNGFWNLKDKLKVSLFDQSGIKSYKVYYINKTETILIEKKISTKQNSVEFDINGFSLPKKDEKIKLAIEVIDNSNWNFFQGNKSYEEFELNIDRTKPIANVIANSYNIKRGGSASVVVKVSDNNLSEKYISFNDKYKFELIPYYKKDYYAAIIAWPIQVEDFDIINLVAIDKAQNKTITKVPLYIKNLKIKNDKIKISKKFINRVSIPVLKQSNISVPTNPTEIFVKLNKELRQKNIDTIRNESIKNMNTSMIKKYSIKPFKRLKGSKTFAGFAERRKYFYEKEQIDEAWHLGMDWASIKHAPVKISNNGEVIFKDYLGIYGNTIIVDHKLGLQSLYAHASKFNVEKGQIVKRNQRIANTGSTGAVFGDHLHFGVLVQGIEVNPLEWMDKSWIKTRITDVLLEAKHIMSSK
ncbi:MAG: M23 family metallopeptidase [Arcobacter sp.]|nr:M23 family metallopeptidase [Arcobacter sp.]